MKAVKIPRHELPLLFGRENRVFQSPLLDLRISENHQQLWRFAVKISKKTASLAVHRHRSKRLVAESIRKLAVSSRTGYDLVFLIKRDFYVNKMVDIYPIVEQLVKEACSV
jgi:ribonuclease P protein component